MPLFRPRPLLLFSRIFHALVPSTVLRTSLTLCPFYYCCTRACSLGLWVERRRWVAPYAGSLGSLFEGPLRGEALMRAPLELRNQAVKQAEGVRCCSRLLVDSASRKEIGAAAVLQTIAAAAASVYCCCCCCLFEEDGGGGGVAGSRCYCFLSLLLPPLSTAGAGAAFSRKSHSTCRCCCCCCLSTFAAVSGKRCCTCL